MLVCQTLKKGTRDAKSSMCSQVTFHGVHIQSTKRHKTSPPEVSKRDGKLVMTWVELQKLWKLGGLGKKNKVRADAARMSLGMLDAWRRAKTKTTENLKLYGEDDTMPPTSKAPALWGRTCHSGTRVAQYRLILQIRTFQIAASPSANVDIPASETSTSSAATLGEIGRALPIKQRLIVPIKTRPSTSSRLQSPSSRCHSPLHRTSIPAVVPLWV